MGKQRVHSDALPSAFASAAGELQAQLVESPVQLGAAVSVSLGVEAAL